MQDNITAELISIGTEILLGQLTDTNSVFLAQTLRDMGINVYFMTSVGDNIDRIEQAISIAFTRADIVITTGGLGPTVDDMTRAGVAKATKRSLVFHSHLLTQIADRFERFNVQMTENNKRQAYLPSDAIAIENPVGTAPAFIVEHGENIVISLPGVPREMKYLVSAKILPYLREKYQLGTIKTRLLKTAGIGESTLDTLIGSNLLEQTNPSVGLAAHSGQIDIRLTAKASTGTEADQMLTQLETLIYQRVGEYIYGIDDEVLEDVIAQMLLHSQKQVVSVEIGFTTPLIEVALKKNNVTADIPIISHHFRDINEFLSAVELVEMREDTRTYREMSRSIAAFFHKQYPQSALLVVIISNPAISEGDDRQESTVVHVHTPTEYRERGYGFGARYPTAQRWIISWALASIWHLLNGNSE